MGLKIMSMATQIQLGVEYKLERKFHIHNDQLLSRDRRLNDHVITPWSFCSR